MFRTKSENSIHETVIDPNFIQFIESKKVPIHPDLDKLVLDTFEKLEAFTSTLISHIDNAYLQQLVELAALTAAASELFAESSNTVNTPSFTTTSTIIATTVHSPKPLIPQLPLQSSISSSSRPSQVLLQAPLLCPLVKPKSQPWQTDMHLWSYQHNSMPCPKIIKAKSFFFMLLVNILPNNM